jgi:rhodanese-related sulfurtransferase
LTRNATRINTTLGEQRRSNYALLPMSKEAFIQVVTAERPTLDQALAREMNPLTLDAVLELQAAGAQVLDTRDATEFASAHLAGSINIGLVGHYATWARTVLDRKNPIVIIADPGRDNESAIRLGRIGFDHVAGYLRGGLQRRPELIAFTERLSAPFAAELLSSARPPLACCNAADSIPLVKLPAASPDGKPQTRRCRVARCAIENSLFADSKFV